MPRAKKYLVGELIHLCNLAKEHIPRCGREWDNVALLHQEWLDETRPGQGYSREGTGLEKKFKSLIKDGSAPTGCGGSMPDHIRVAREAWMTMQSVAESKLVLGLQPMKKHEEEEEEEEEEVDSEKTESADEAEIKKEEGGGGGGGAKLSDLVLDYKAKSAAVCPLGKGHRESPCTSYCRAYLRRHKLSLQDTDEVSMFYRTCVTQ